MTNLAFEGVDHMNCLARGARGRQFRIGLQSASLEPSYVLGALGLPERLAFPSCASPGQAPYGEEVNSSSPVSATPLGELRVSRRLL